jgi:hypothetical protein
MNHQEHRTPTADAPDAPRPERGLADQLARATTGDDPQDIGRRAREILLDRARQLADPSLVPAGQPQPKADDAKAWLDLFVAAHASGSARKELRRFVGATWELVQKAARGDCDRLDAFAAAQATALVVRALEELAPAR